MAAMVSFLGSWKWLCRSALQVKGLALVVAGFRA